MGQTDLIRVLEQDVKRQSEEILKEAHEAAKKMVREAALRSKETRELRLMELRRELDGRRAAAVNRAHIKTRALLVAAKSGIIEEVIKRALETLERLPEERLERLLKRYYEELKGAWPMNERHGRPVVYVHPSEARFIGNSEFEVRPAEDVRRGVVFATPDGRVRLINTVRTRLERAKKALVPLLDRKLFGE